MYYQIPVNSEGIPKTAVTPLLGLFEFVFTLFGLRNAGETLQKYIHSVLLELNFCVPYYDDILVASADKEVRMLKLHRNFSRLKDYNLKLNPSKCMLGKSSVYF